MPHETLDQLLRHARKERLWEARETTRPLALDQGAIQALIPHRPPFLLLDGLSAVDENRGALAGTRVIDPQDPVFLGHFPGHPVYPGVLQIEILAQLSACFLPLIQPGATEKAFATSYKSIFIRPVLPGDRLELLMLRVGEEDGLVGRSVGQILCNRQICCVAAIEACYVD